jgi:poly(hydroxyalkanoate) depolymerase family esterase
MGAPSFFAALHNMSRQKRRELMAGLSDTLANMARYRRGLGRMPSGLMRDGIDLRDLAPAGRLGEVADFGANPGELRLLSCVPRGLKRGAGLVVVLHGCGQTAAGYDQGAGWSELAERFGFALLLPEQRRGNNAGTCFNWFQPDDTTRGHGEAASIRAMIQHMLAHHGLDRGRVFITGLSAGGAFANVMLATYPELFAAGAIVAGLPYGAARNTQGALELMYRGQPRSDTEWGDRVRSASAHRGPWPRIAVWHGLADTTVIPANGTAIVRQWLDVHGLADASARRASCGPAEHMHWQGRDGRTAVECYTLAQMSHGVPISAADPDEAQRCGQAGAFILETGLSSSYVMAESWGLAPKVAARAAAAAMPAAGVAGVIQKALRAAGLVG